MKPQFIQDADGNNTGVFIPIKDWALIESIYPDIKNLETELPQWQKDIIDERLDAIAKNPQRLKPIEFLFQYLENED